MLKDRRKSIIVGGIIVLGFLAFVTTIIPTQTTPSQPVIRLVRTVSHYYGDHSAPVELYELECKIDEIVNTNQWIGREQVFCREWIGFMTK
jgi:hypothetical protein